MCISMSINVSILAWGEFLPSETIPILTLRRLYTHIYFFPFFGFDGKIWDLILSIPDHCLSFHSDKFEKKSDWKNN